MIKCFEPIDGTLKDFYNAHKDLKNYRMIGYFTLVDWQVGHYYGVQLQDGTKQVLRCTQVEDNNSRPTFVSETTPIAGPINITKIIWEKSEEEMYKPDCCNG